MREINLLRSNSPCIIRTVKRAPHSSRTPPAPLQRGSGEEIHSISWQPAPEAPPTILVELYFVDDPGIARFKGKNNSLRQDSTGVKLSIEFNEEYQEEYAEYVADPAIIKTIPIEYYIVRWRDFADNDITARSIPIKSSFIDASTIRNNSAASRYVLDLVKDGLSKKEQVDLALSYRLMTDTPDTLKSNGSTSGIKASSTPTRLPSLYSPATKRPTAPLSVGSKSVLIRSISTNFRTSPVTISIWLSRFFAHVCK